MIERAGESAAYQYDPTYEVFRDLMPFRVRELLLVSSQYDSFVLEEDGQLAESLDVEYYQLKLSSAPRITRVPTGEAALEMIRKRDFDLVIALTRLGGMDPLRFARELKETQPDLPLILLADNPPDANRVKQQNQPRVFDQVFVWRGDVALFLAIIKYVEDLRNVAHDARLAGVRTIILVENSVRFYSTYLPRLYTAVMEQTQSLMADSVNIRQRLRRMKARPKILLAETFEEGWGLFETYRSCTLGVITDARFPRNGETDDHAGLEFVRCVKAVDADMPALIQSSDTELRERARELGADFLNKRTPRLLDEIVQFLRKSLGFGDFVFQLADGTEVARVRDVAGMQRVLEWVPVESICFHASRNHFSNWCMARTEFDLAARMRPIKVDEFDDPESMRRYLVDAFRRLRTEARRGVVAEFSRAEDEAAGFVRIGGGSMGGKGRGLAFINSLLLRRPEREDEVRVVVPTAAVVGTEVFDAFLRENGLQNVALSEATDEEIESAFLAAPLPAEIVDDLRAFVSRTDYPLAVRSSSLLEDSHDQPFAGIYRTYMLANRNPILEVRLRELCDAIRLVYASTFSSNAKAYLANTPYRPEEEKMAIVLQRLVGRAHDRFFYPDFAGVARSFNYYPVFDQVAEEGISLVGLGFGRTVVEGGRAVRFSPGAPGSLPQFSSTSEIVRNAQREFYALDLERHLEAQRRGHEDGLVQLELEDAEAHGTLHAVGSVYSRDNDVVYDGISRSGIRLVTFASILKGRLFPLAEVLRDLLALGREAMSCPVEIEFAVNLKGEAGRPEFGLVQIRPMAVEVGTENLDEALQGIDDRQVLCASEQALGHGRHQEIFDVVYVRNEAFDRGCTQAVATDVGQLNGDLVKGNRPYLLIGPGRWGTSDRWLGIPVEWRQISGARAIVETDLDDTPVAPSEGTHFFQNLTSFGIGYFTVDRSRGHGRVDFEWLDAQPAHCETQYLRHVRLADPLDIHIDGRSRRGVVLKGENS